MLYSLRSFWQSASVSAVFPDPTGLLGTQGRHLNEDIMKLICAPSNSHCEASLLEVTSAVVWQVALGIFA